MEVTGYRLSPQESAMVEPYRASVRSQLEKAGWDEALAEGRTMSIEAAIGYALSEEGSSTATPSTTPDHPARLTPREIEVLGLVATGLTTPQVAQRLFISPRTVQRHLNSVYRKIGVGSRTAATRFALEHDLA